MTTDNVSHVKEGALHPEEPMRLIKFIVINSDGTYSYALKLRTTPIKLIFKNVGYLIGNNLTFVIPKYVNDSANQLYQIEQPSKINIVDMDNKIVPFNIIPAKATCVFYLNITIKDTLACYGDLILTFNQFDLALTHIPKPYSLAANCTHPNPDQWRWFASSVTIP
jgi:hypothetical protein